MEIRGGVTDAGQTNNKQTLKIELLSQWMIEAEFRNESVRIDFIDVDEEAKEAKEAKEDE